MLHSIERVNRNSFDKPKMQKIETKSARIFLLKFFDSK